MGCMLSIIVPIYNVESYLEICLRSLIGQTLRDIEIILVDDGSTDRSGEIAQAFADKDSRIRLVRQRNQGQGMARNVGLDMANGKYVAFVDSDDWVILSAYERLVQEAELYNVDIVMGNVMFCFSNGKRIDRYKRIDKSIFEKSLSGINCFVSFSEQNALSPMIVTYLYRRDFLEKNNLHFEQTIHEDELWVPQSLCLAQTAKVIDFNFYAYRQREGSTMNSSNYKKRYEALLHIAECLTKFTLLFTMDKSQKELVSWLYVKIIWIYYYACVQLRYLPESYRLSYLERLYKMEGCRPNILSRPFFYYHKYNALIRNELKDICDF